MKKVLIIVAIVVVVIGIAAGIFGWYAAASLKALDSEFAKITPIDMSRVEDGVYHAGFGGIPVSVDLAVTVKDHTIWGITIAKQGCGRGYEARETIDRIKAAQSCKVDVVAKATYSSKCIMVAADKALHGTRK
jgi:uncharacterized protein with FMN-binding domain